MLSSPDDGVPVLRTRAGRIRSIVIPLLILCIVAAIVILVLGRGQQGQLIGAGSTLAQPLIERSTVAYRDAKAADNPSRPDQTGSDWMLDGSGITYEPVGSLGGLMRLDDPEVDFAVSDYPLSPGGLAERQVAQFPVALGALAVVHNLELPGGQPLRLDAKVLSRIYLGEITQWQDPALAALNPSVSLPAGPITVVYRGDGSGSTYAFSGYLSSGSPQWANTLGTGTQLAWPTGVMSERSSGMIERIRETPGAIGYVEQGQASRAGLQTAALGNAGGNFVVPSKPAMLSAVRDHDWSGSDNYTKPLATSNDGRSYPLTVPVYAMVKRDPAFAQDTTRTINYLGYLMTDFEGASDLGYLPLPAEAAEPVRAYLQAQLQALNS